MKKTVKIISTILIALFVVCAVANVALAVVLIQVNLQVLKAI